MGRGGASCVGNRVRKRLLVAPACTCMSTLPPGSRPLWFAPSMSRGLTEMMARTPGPGGGGSHGVFCASGDEW